MYLNILIYLCGKLIEYMRHLFLFFLIVSVLACTRTVDIANRLLEVESIIEENPDSAFVLLNAYNGNYVDEQDIALYNLLYVQAETKLDIVETSQNLTRKSIRYFRSKGDVVRLMKSLFYDATVAFNNGAMNDAIGPAMEARDLAINLSDDYWIAKISELIGQLFVASYQYDEALPYISESVKAYKDAGRVQNHLFAVCALASVYSAEKNEKRYEELMDSVWDVAVSTDSLLMYYVGSSRFMEAMGGGNTDKAARFFAIANECNGLYPSSALSSLCAQYEALDGDIDNALALVRVADSLAVTVQDSAVLYNAYSVLYAQTGDFKNEAINSRKVIQYQNRELEKVLAQSVAIEQRNMYEREVAAGRENMWRLRMWIMVGAFVFAGVAVWGVWYYRMRLRRKNAEIERQASDVLLLQASLGRRSREDAEVRSRMQQLYRKQWDTIGRLTKRLKNMKDTDRGRADVLRKIEGELCKLANPQQLERLVGEIDDVFGGIVGALRSAGSNLSADEITLVALLLADMDTTTVCRLTGVNKNTYYTRRRRLQQKLDAAAGAGDAESAESVVARKLALVAAHASVGEDGEDEGSEEQEDAPGPDEAAVGKTDGDNHAAGNGGACEQQD